MSPPSQRTRPPTLLTTSTSTATAASTTSMSTSSFSQDISRAILSASTHTPKAAVALPDRPTRETPLESDVGQRVKPARELSTTFVCWTSVGDSDALT
ncbi:hypothetical protein BO70DRAFT_392291 [Aspergillus heteromorphus CBS 117.55]|uniref:Uncharacterized protein n=1 Tax=Aspergillus heteromorphus CBS 117.55 TaxID=1448321 RepID=A0A317X5M5_9EURO|nr:uncharacterized protein BO70DRAFT_392291 [Aspergillus heteromorphus CBS 117.55]PWY92922.1 hypothetical protein BO70DRAFT_392291 [Aspergillus heteromorphus CBS 117.55]